MTELFDCYSYFSGIDIETKERLEKIGALVPFNSIDHSLNNFFYFPKDKQLPDNILTQDSYFKLDGCVTRASVDKHIAKSIKVSAIKVSDIVNSHTYKDLPMEVLAIEGSKAKLRIRLRNYETELWEDIRQLKLITNHFEEKEQVEYSAIPSVEFSIQLGGNVIIDCDILDTSNYAIEYSHLFRTILRFKTSYSNLNVIVANPLEASLELSRDLGLIVAYGDLKDIIKNYLPDSDKLYIVTENQELSLCGKLKVITLEQELTEIDYKDYLFNEYNIEIRDLTQDEKDFLYNYIVSYKKLKNHMFPPSKPIAVIQKLHIDIEYLSKTKVKTDNSEHNVETEDYFNNFKVANYKLSKKFERLNLNYIATNVEYYSKIIKS